jgi:hypothetical protein
VAHLREFLFSLTDKDLPFDEEFAKERMEAIMDEFIALDENNTAQTFLVALLQGREGTYNWRALRFLLHNENLLNERGRFEDARSFDPYKVKTGVFDTPNDNLKQEFSKVLSRSKYADFYTEWNGLKPVRVLYDFYDRAWKNINTEKLPRSAWFLNSESPTHLTYDVSKFPVMRMRAVALPYLRCVNRLLRQIPPTLLSQIDIVRTLTNARCSHYKFVQRVEIVRFTRDALKLNLFEPDPEEEVDRRVEEWEKIGNRVREEILQYALQRYRQSNSESESEMSFSQKEIFWLRIGLYDEFLVEPIAAEQQAQQMQQDADVDEEDDADNDDGSGQPSQKRARTVILFSNAIATQFRK